jgi:hypothetical protein
MALKTLPYDALSPLVKDYLSAEEGEETAALIRDLRPARKRGYLTPTELEWICRWKSARAIRHIRSNSASLVRSATMRALKTRSEQQRLAALTQLSGVSVPMASAILMLLDPKRYGVIDIRVWQVLYAVGAVSKTPSGIGFTFKHWYQFLMIIRYLAKALGVSARDVERSLFEAHQDYQRGTLYKTA